ncbi:dihydroorotate dehydrogenase (quinone), partial [bacterium]
REGLQSPNAKETGGLSGLPVKAKADAALRRLRAASPPGLVLIGVGGIMTPQDAQDRLEAGADLVQVYTGWVYGGPDFVGEVVGGLNKA